MESDVISTKPPRIEDIEAYIKAKNPLSIADSPFTVSDIDPSVFSGHFNYLVEGKDGRVVLRLKGPEWGSPIDGIENEYNILRFIERYEVAPAPLYFDRAGIKGSPVMFIEYLDGALFPALSIEEQKTLLPSIGTFIAEINSIPVEENVLPFDYSLTSYAPHKEKWWKRLLEAKEDVRLQGWCEKTEQLLSRAESMLTQFEPALGAVIERGDSCFVFISSHAGHLMVTEKGLRFLNWEGVRYGDPTFTMGVFLSSIASFPYAKEAWKLTVDRYLEERPVVDFEGLLEQRVRERAVSDFTWLLWRQLKNGNEIPIEEDKLQQWYALAAQAVLG